MSITATKEKTRIEWAPVDLLSRSRISSMTEPLNSFAGMRTSTFSPSMPPNSPEGSNILTKSDSGIS